MKCMQCGHTMTTKRENVPYTALPGTVLASVEVSRCPNCGEYEVAIPAIDDLNKMLANEVIRKSERLTGPEIRFLRTYLGYSAADFGKLIGSNQATLSRWENDKQPIGHHADLLLRAMVAMEKRIEGYSITSFADVIDEAPKTKVKHTRAFVLAGARKWKPTELAAAA